MSVRQFFRKLRQIVSPKASTVSLNELSTKTKSDLVASINRSKVRRKVVDDLAPSEKKLDDLLRKSRQRKKAKEDIAAAAHETLRKYIKNKSQKTMIEHQEEYAALANMVFTGTSVNNPPVTTSSTGTGMTSMEQWSAPNLVQTLVNPDSIELVYTQYKTYSVNSFGPTERCFKIVYSVVDGKWNQSAPIYGQIIPASGITYQID